MEEVKCKRAFVYKFMTLTLVKYLLNDFFPPYFFSFHLQFFVVQLLEFVGSVFCIVYGTMLPHDRSIFALVVNTAFAACSKEKLFDYICNKFYFQYSL